MFCYSCVIFSNADKQGLTSKFEATTSCPPITYIQKIKPLILDDQTLYSLTPYSLTVFIGVHPLDTRMLLCVQFVTYFLAFIQLFGLSCWML